MWKSILSVVFSLVCLVIVTSGTLEAKGGSGGGRSGGGRGQVRRVTPQRPTTVSQPVAKTPKSLKPATMVTKKDKDHHKHKHKHKHKGDGDADADGGDGGEAEEAEGTDADEAPETGEAEEAEVGLYGVEITGLYKGTAAKEGLEVGDIILSFNGTATPDFDTLANAVAGSGSEAQVVVVRGEDGERETVKLFPQEGRIGVSGERVRVKE